jgi:hypothetical protein
MSTVNEQIQNYWESQQEIFAPMRAFGGVAAETFERIARQNYAVFGDYVEFAVEQLKLSTQARDATDYFGRNWAQTQAFGAKLARRAQEYVEIAQSVQAKTQDAVGSADKRVARKAA